MIPRPIPKQRLKKLNPDQRADSTHITYDLSSKKAAALISTAVFHLPLTDWLIVAYYWHILIAHVIYFLCGLSRKIYASVRASVHIKFSSELASP